MLRKIQTFTQGGRQAVVYRDVEWNEYRTRFYTEGVHHVDADSHTDDKQDALQTAESWVNPKPGAVQG